MKRSWLLGIMLALSLVEMSSAQVLGDAKPDKTTRQYIPNVPSETRLVGDTILEAVPVFTVPYDTVGITTGFNDEYDEICPYDGSTAPDVVYEIAFDRDRIVDIDMFMSSYDTKIYLYDENMTLIGCNDDYYPDYTSKLENLRLEASLSYYLFIDGYGESHGEYTLSILSSPPPCYILPGCNATLEEEPPLVDDYIDVHNGGCNSEEYGAPFTQLPYPGDTMHSEFSGTTGWYVFEGTNMRDTDWLRGVIPMYGYLEVEIESEFPIYVFELGPQDCESVAVIQSFMVDPCETRYLGISGTPYSEVWLWVGPRTYEPPEGLEGREGRYRLSMSGSLPGSCLDTDSDYSFDCTEAVVEYYEASFLSGSLVNDIDFDGLCGVGYETPGGDLMVSAYMEAGGYIGFQWHPYYYEPRDETRYVTCMALFDDLRPDQKSCIDYTCVSGYNQFSGVSAGEEGWYWFVIDVSSEESTAEWGVLGFDGLAQPPTPPNHDTCDGAIPLPVGPFDFQDDLTSATNSFDPGRHGCPDAPHTTFTSRDVVYEVQLTQGQLLDVTMSGMVGWDAVLYLVRDCEDPVDQCVMAGEHEDGGLHLKYNALDDELLWLVCDSYGHGPRPFSLSGHIDTPSDATPLAPAGLSLGVAPNPFNPRTTFSYELPQDTEVRLRIHSLDGRVVTTLANGQAIAGRYEAVWEGRDRDGRTMPSGVYVARLETANKARTIRVVLLK